MHTLCALGFIGLPISVARGISYFAQVLLVAHTLTDPALPPPALVELHAQEATLDHPARTGHESHDAAPHTRMRL